MLNKWRVRNRKIRMAANQELNSLELQSVEERLLSTGLDEILLQTNSGTICCILHAVSKSSSAVIWVGGAVGGLDGPADGLYPRLASVLANDGIASLRLDYRRPNDLAACVLDTLLGISYLEDLGIETIILVGHSFGGAVVITAGASSKAVAGVVALSSQNAGTEQVSALAPRPLLLLHGSADPVLPDKTSQEIFYRALEPKQIILYPGCGHHLSECRYALEKDLLDWIRKVLL
jgi:alpha/beta superfamily hydrolase